MTQNAQIVPQSPLALERQGQAEVGVERALVEFVEQHRRDAVEPRVVEDHAREHALGHHLDARPGADLGREARPQADRIADPLAEGIGHTLRRVARSKPPRLENQDLASLHPRLAEQRQRHARRLAGAGRRHQHSRRAGPERFGQVSENDIDGERGSQFRHGAHVAQPRARVDRASVGALRMHSDDGSAIPAKK